MPKKIDPLNTDSGREFCRVNKKGTKPYFKEGIVRVAVPFCMSDQRWVNSTMRTTITK